MTRKIMSGAVGGFCLAAFLTFGLQTASVADMTVTQEITSTLGKEKSTSTQNIYWTKSKMRTGHPAGMISIVDLDAKTMTILNPKAKSYTRRSFDEIKKDEAGVPEQVRDAKLSVRETGEKKTVDGYSCEKLVLKIGPTEITVWATNDIKIEPALSEFNKKFLELTKDIKILNIQGQMRAVFEEKKVYPYLTVIEVSMPFGGGTQRTESKVKKVSYDKIDASVFAIPAGYKETPLPQMPGQK